MKPNSGKRLRISVILGVLTIFVLALTVQVAGAAPYKGSVSGRVTDTKGNPIAGITVQPWAKNPTSSNWYGVGNWAVTDANGVYTVKFDNNSWIDPTSLTCTILFDERRQLIPSDRYYRDTWWQNIDGTHTSLMPETAQAAKATHFDLPNGSALTGFDVKMKVYRAKISGKITDRAGKPLSGIDVAPYGKAFKSQGVYTMASVRTGADGKYELWVDPRLEEGTWWAIFAQPRNSNAYFSRWYGNVLGWQITTKYADQASAAGVYHFTLDSDQSVENADISLTENKADKLTFSYAKPKKKGSKTLIAAGYLNPAHDPTVKITAKIYKYNVSKKKYVYKYTVPVKQSASGLKTKWSISKKVSKGKYQVKVSVGKHLWGLHRATSASKKVTIK